MAEALAACNGTAKLGRAITLLGKNTHRGGRGERRVPGILVLQGAWAASAVDCRRTNGTG